jgi:hypothetical protein
MFVFGCGRPPESKLLLGSHSLRDEVGQEEQDSGETEKAELNQGGADPPQPNEQP